MLVAEVLAGLSDVFDAIHADAWFANEPSHLEVMLARIRPGGVLTMPNWFLLVDVLTGAPRNDWESFAGPCWQERILAYGNIGGAGAC